MPDQESITLAPAAGAGIGKKVAEKLLADEGFIQDLVDAFRDGLKACTVVYQKGNPVGVQISDQKTRLATAMAVLAHMEGEPIKRIIHQHLGSAMGSAEETLEKAAEQSPALRRRLLNLLQRAELAPPKQVGPAKVEPVDID